jgi:hypothetical protein
VKGKYPSTPKNQALKILFYMTSKSANKSLSFGPKTENLTIKNIKL